MTIVNYSTAFNALDLYVKRHNSNTKPLAKHIRQAMISTTREIIKIYALSLIKANKVAPLDLEAPLPPLKTNNVQLSKKTNTCTRTIQRHIQRLIDANIITKKVWHGSNSSYELFINPEILLISGQEPYKKPVDKTEIEQIQSKPKQSEKQSFKKVNTTSCLHTDTSNNRYNNIIIAGLKTKMCSLPPRVKNATQSGTRNIFSGYTGWKRAKIIDDTGGNVRKRVTIQTGAEISGQNVARSATLTSYVNNLWELALSTIYKDAFITKTQLKKAKELLYLWYEPVPDKHLLKVHECYVKRIKMVEKYIDKDRENRYVQFPSTYFNPTNLNGFTGTKKWYNQQKAQQQKLQSKLIVHAQARRFLNNEKKDTAYQKPRLALFRECEIRIRELERPELLKQFHAKVLGNSILS